VCAHRIQSRPVQGVPGNDHHAILAFRNLRTEASDAARRGAASLDALSPLIRKGSGRKRKENRKRSEITSFLACSLYEFIHLV